MRRFALNLGSIGILIVVVIALGSCSKLKKAINDATGEDAGLVVGGSVTALVGTVVLQINGGADLEVTESGSFEFTDLIPTGDTYTVTVLTQPDGQICTLTGATGTMAEADVTDVAVSCAYNPATPTCDSGLVLDSTDAADAAKAMDLCDGVDSASWLLPNDGALLPPDVMNLANYHLGHGILPDFGTVTVQAGMNLLAISSGTARDSADPGFISPSGAGFNKGITMGSLPVISGFPSMGDQGRTGGACNPVGTTGNDGASLVLQLTVPPGANAFQFDWKFYAADYSGYVCSAYVDQVAVVINSTNLSTQNILLSSLGNPVNLNIYELNVCTPVLNYTCPSGTGDLVGTGYEGRAATDWNTQQVPVEPGETFTLKFMIWDSQDFGSDSTLLIDNFQWYSY